MTFTPTVLFESFDPQGRGWSCVFQNPLAVYSARTLNEVVPLLQEADRASRDGQWVALMLSYEAAPALDSAMAVLPSNGFPLAWLAVFHEAFPSVCAVEPPSFLNPRWDASMTQSDYGRGIRDIRSAIARGDCYQVNYTFPMECKFEGDAWAWYRALGMAQGAGYCAWIDCGRYRVMSFSPELFFERQGNVLRARPMKGTAPRGRWASEDDNQRHRLEESAKNRAENLMIVDLLRNDLGRVSVPGTVRVPRLFEIERYPTLFQMTSTVESICLPQIGLVEILSALFPCGSVTGAPKISAMKLIRDLETSPRGVYTGAIGLIRPGGDCTFNVAIRTLELDTETGRAVFGVGGGITFDSTPEDEYAECLTKARFLAEAPPVFQLIETLRLEQGTYFLLRRHIARLMESAAFFGFALDEVEVCAAFEAIRTEQPKGEWKVRLLASAKGELHVEASPLLPSTNQLCRVAFATVPLDSASPFLCHKTTYRAFYEQPLGDCPNCDDLIFWNEHGEVTESSIANVVVEVDGQKWTPSRS